MALFLVALGGTAIIEFHRKLTGGPKDVRILRERETELKKKLEELELRLMKTENEREYNEQEAEKYAAAKEQLQAERAALQDELDALAAENKEIKDTSERLAQSLALVEETVQTEKAENELLRGQLKSLKLQHTENMSQIDSKYNELKFQVADIITSYVKGNTAGLQMVESLKELGVEVKASKENLKALVNAANQQEKANATQNILQTNDLWKEMSGYQSAAFMSMFGQQQEPSSAAPTNLNGSMSARARITTPPRLVATKASTNTSSSSSVLPAVEVKADTIPAIHSSSSDETINNNNRSLFFKSANKKGNKRAHALHEPQKFETTIPLCINSGVPSLDLGTSSLMA